MSSVPKKRKLQPNSDGDYEICSFHYLRLLLGRGLPAEPEYGRVCEEILSEVNKNEDAAKERLSYMVTIPPRGANAFPRRRGKRPARGRRSILPLFVLCSVQPPRRAVEAVHRAHPEAIEWVDDVHGRTALHFACVRGASADVVEFLIEARPAALGIFDRYGDNPLSIAPPECLELMIRKCPESLWGASDARRLETWGASRSWCCGTPAFCKIISRVPVRIILNLLHMIETELPEILHKVDEKYQRTLLHWACIHDAPADLINIVAKKLPEAFRCKGDKYGDTPLHCFIHHTEWDASSHDSIHCLLSTSPSLAIKANNKGETPIFALWDVSKPPDEDEFVFDPKDPDGVEADQAQRQKAEILQRVTFLLLRAGHYGTIERNLPPTSPGGSPRVFRPLHAACGSGCPHDLFDKIVSDHAQQICERDEEGNTPLVLSLERALTDSGNDLKIFNRVGGQCQKLLSVCPEAASMVGAGGRLPLHLALEAGFTWDGWLDFLIRDLVLASPKSVEQLDPHTNLFPFQMAAVHALQINDDYDAGTVYELLLRCPSLVRAGPKQER